MFNSVINRVQNDEGEKAIVQGFLERFKHAAAVGVLHFWLILKFQDLQEVLFGIFRRLQLTHQGKGF